MPAADIVVFNQSNAVVTIQSQMIAAGGSYSIPFANLAAWAVDPFLRAYLLGGQCYLVVLGSKLTGGTAFSWMDSIFRGSIVYPS